MFYLLKKIKIEGIAVDRTKLTIHINKMKLNSLESFFCVNGRFVNYEKDNYFVRYIGYENEKNYINQILKNESENQKSQAGYYRVGSLPKGILANQASFYHKQYSNLKTDHSSLECHFHFKDKVLEASLVSSFFHILHIYKQNKTHCTDTILKNFATKLLFWIDEYYPLIFPDPCNLSYSSKFIYYGDIKLQEYLFLYLIVLSGCDVLYLNPLRDISFEEPFMELSYAIIESKLGCIDLPDYKVELSQSDAFAKSTVSNPVIASGMPSESSVTVKLPQRQKHTTNASKVDFCEQAIKSNSIAIRQEFSIEELAKLAPSVVLIGAFDQKGECFKMGSGVMIGKNGYILTNFHVISDANYFYVRIEGEKDAYETTEIIKYSPLFDLAILRINKICKPIPICKKEINVVRGQKVVAIGSPLGLFNTVSDGIISGFRKIDEISMIQVTAPISHGSSGGALLNMNGEIVGLTTAGFDDGQNLNLAVDHKTLHAFIGGSVFE